MTAAATNSRVCASHGRSWRCATRAVKGGHAIAAGAQQIFLAGQPFAPWQRGEDLEAFIEKVNQIPIGPGGTPVFSAHQMCSAKLGSDPQTCVAKPNGELHDTTGVWIADASGMPCCSGVNPMVSVMALARRTATNMLNQP